MKSTSAIGFSAFGIAVLSLFLIGPAVNGGGQVPKLVKPPLAFEVVSLKRTGNMEDHRIFRNGMSHIAGKRVQYQGLRLSGDAPLDQIIEFACSPLLAPYRQVVPRWTQEEYYRIEAIAPAGTTPEDARVMVRTALAQRLGLRYHIADQETPVYNLLRGDGKLKLTPAIEADTDSGFRRMWVFKMKSASLADFAEFLSPFTGRGVVDRTGLPGRYRFDVDWNEEIRQDPGNALGVALASVKSMGLKLEPGKAIVKLLVIDQVSKEPTAN